MVLNDVGLTPINAGSLTGVYIEGYSRVRVRFTAANCTLEEGESLVGGYISFKGITTQANSALMAVSSPLETGANVIKCTAISSTGAESTIEKTVTACDYYPPTAEVSAVRCKANGTASESGAYIKVTATPNYASCGGHNAVTGEVRWKLRSAADYGSPSAMSGNSVVIGGSFTLNDTVDILVTVTDTVGNDADYGLQVLSDFWPLRFTADGKGVALLGAVPVNGELVLPAGTRIRIGNTYIN